MAIDFTGPGFALSSLYMELGISMFGDLHINSGHVQPAHEKLREIIEQVRLMDELGLDFFGIGEHHRPDYAVSTPEMVLAAAASVTKNIKLGSAVSVLSSSDPVKLYQSFATLDGLSAGRAELMVGRGSFTESFPVYGYSLNDYEALFEEKLELLVHINKNSIINWQGKYRAPLKNQQLFPRPFNKELALWVAVGGTPESVLRAARYGIPIIFAIIGGSPAQFQPLFEFYKQKYIEFGHEPANIQTGVHMHCFLGQDGSKTADEYYPLYAAQMNRIGAQRGWPPYQRRQFDLGRGRNGALIIGDANEAVDKILDMKERFGLTRFSAHMDVGAPPRNQMMKSIEIFATKVAEKVRAA